MSVSLVPELPGFEIEKIECTDSHVVVHARAVYEEAHCPVCGATTSQVHSCYIRTPADLPYGGKSVRLRLEVRRFFCPNPCCHRKTFAERLPNLVPVHAQRTQRATDTLTELAFGCGGELGARLSMKLGMGVSPDTLIRLIRNRPEPEQPAVRVVAVDDWAKRKGRTYGTILVDLEHHQPIDLLPDREAATLSSWLKNQPQVEVLSRDRAKAYAQGASAGAPNSLQVADRWHLLKNFGDTVRDIFENHRSYLTWRIPLPSSISETTTGGWDILNDRTAERKRLSNRSKRLARYQQVVGLREKGLAMREIARQVGVSCHTVERYLACDSFPEHKRRQPQVTQLTPYLDYISQRWEEGCTNGTHIWRELCKQGFCGSQASVLKHVRRLRRGLSLQRQDTRVKPAYEVRRCTASQAAWLFCCDPDRLNGEEIRDLATLMRTCPNGPFVYELAQVWRELIQNRAKDALAPWLTRAEQTDVAELRRFVSGIRGDLSAVYAALTVEWSNGQAEGQITRLKLIKRQMYGRANFDLLRRRVLYSA
jgi:transposase